MQKIKIFGAPGTGKTHQLIEVFKKTVADGTHPSEIMVCTFRKSAAQELMDNLNLEKKDRRYMGTIHSICYKLLGQPEMITKKDIQQYCISVGLALPQKNNYNPHGVDLPPSTKQASFFNLYSWMKNTHTPLDKIATYPHIKEIKVPTPHIKNLITQYEAYKKEIDKIDFTDQISKVVEKELVPYGVKALLVDEFQDLTPAQYKVFEIWADNMDLVAIAGDPNQTIYPFWGASSKFFTEYDAGECVLSVTHRVPTPIWNTAKRLLELNDIPAPSVESDKVGTLIRIDYLRAEHEARKYSKNTLHLVRSNYQGAAISYLLAEAGIIHTGINSWTDSEMSLLNGIIAVRNRAALQKNEVLELLNRYPDRFFICESTKEKLIESTNESMKTVYDKNDYSVLFNRNPTLFENDTLYDVIGSADPTTHMIGATKLFKTKLLNAISKHTKRVVIDKHTVKIQTIHGAKGGEADTVFLHTGITPKIKKAMRIKEGRQNEARVFFVGLTRTAKTCFVIKDKGSANYNIPAVVS